MAKGTCLLIPSVSVVIAVFSWGAVFYLFPFHSQCCCGLVLCFLSSIVCFMVLFLFQRCKYAAKVHIILDTTMGKVVFFDGMLKNTTCNLHCVIAVLQYAICNKQFASIFLGVYKYIYFNYIIYII